MDGGKINTHRREKNVTKPPYSLKPLSFMYCKMIKLSLGVPFPRSTQCVRDFSIFQFQFLVSHNTDVPIHVCIPCSSHVIRYTKNKMSP